MRLRRFVLFAAAMLMMASVAPALAQSFSTTDLARYGVEIVKASKRTIVGTSTGWMPLKELAPQIGMGDEYVDQIIDANLTFSCPYITKDGTRLMAPANAWALKGDLQHVFTNAHAVLNKEQRFRPDLAECELESARDQMGAAPPSLFHVNGDAASIALGAAVGADGIVAKHGFTKDRARLSLSTSVPMLEPLSLGVYAPLVEGQMVLAVSTGQMWRSEELMAQACTARKVYLASAGSPGGLFTDCHNQNGNSGMLYFAASEPNCGEADGSVLCTWRPVAMHSGARQKDPDNSPWHEKTNTAYAITIDEYFFSYAN